MARDTLVGTIKAAAAAERQAGLLAKQMPARRADEHGLQSALVEYLRYRKAGPMAIPNEGKDRAHPARLARLIAAGLEPGAPDLILRKLANNGRPVAIECKAPGKKPRKNQRDVIEEMRAQGWIVLVCDDLEKTIKTLETLGF